MVVLSACALLPRVKVVVMNHQVKTNFENPAADHVAPISAAFTTKARNLSIKGCYFSALFDLWWKYKAKEIRVFMYLLKKKKNTGRKFKKDK